MKKFFRLFFAFLFFVAALGLGAGAAAFSGPYAKPARAVEQAARSPQARRALQRVEAQLVRPVKEAYEQSDLYRQNDPLKLRASGMARPFGGAALAAFLLSLILLLTGKKQKTAAAPKGKKGKAAPQKAAPAARVAAPPPAATESAKLQMPASAASGAANAAAPAPAPAAASVDSVDASEWEDLLGEDDEMTPEKLQAQKTAHLSKVFGGKSFFVPDELLDDEFTDRGMFYDVERVVSMTQSSVDDKRSHVVMASLRPEYLPFLDRFDEHVRIRLTRQVLNHHVLRLKREEQGISADQFVTQDKRMSDAEREVFCRRFMPKTPADLSADDRLLIGEVYTLTEQSHVQQKTSTQVDDWRDISLRNLVEVMSAEPNR